MSSEYKDYYYDLRERFDDAVSKLDSLPSGWVRSFVPQLKDELFNALGQYAEDFCVLDCKEKYEEMRLYWCFPDRDYYTDEDYDYLEKLCPKIEAIVNKYEIISGCTCVKCGAPATHFKDGLPYCEEDN